MIPNPNLLRASQIARDPLPPLDWLIKGMMGFGDKAVIAGEFGTFKTWVLYHMALHLALGKEWLGFPIPQPRKVFYVDEETPEWERRRRLKRIMEAERMPADNPNLDNLVITSMGFTVTPSNLAIFNNILSRSTYKPEVIIMETLARVSEGDENSAGAIAALWRNIMQYLQVERTTVIISHHMNKPGMDDDRELRHRIRGSTDIPAGGDTIIGMRALGATKKGQSEISSIKPRFSKPFDSFNVMLVETNPNKDPDNTPITVKRLDPPEKGKGMFQQPGIVCQ